MVVVKPTVKAPKKPSVRVSVKSTTTKVTPKTKEKSKASEKPVIKRRETEKKKKLAQLLVTNLGNGKPLNMTQLFIKAGYSKASARSQTDILNSVREEPEVKGIVTKLKEHQKKMLARMDKTVDRAGYGAVAFATPGIAKTIELLEGRATRIVKHKLSEEEEGELDDILETNS